MTKGKILGVLFSVLACGAMNSAFAASHAISQSAYPQCNGGRFTSCVCADSVPPIIQYRVSEAECNGNAAVILSGPFAHSYSVVVRDRENRDRWPVTGFGGCSKFQSLILGLNRCSAFKVQKIIKSGTGAQRQTINCLGAPGDSTLFQDVVRITIKISNRDGADGQKPLFRACLPHQPADLN